jgi:hypothetical protein
MWICKTIGDMFNPYMNSEKELRIIEYKCRFKIDKQHPK